MQTPHLTILELSGHIIDSLTLAKVIDRIQAAGCQYQINDLQIGQCKNDISTVQISLWANDPEIMTPVLADLKTYGALPVDDMEVRTASCPADGQLPDDVYVRHTPPTEILFHGTWLKVDRAGLDMVIVLSPDGQSVAYKSARDVQRGDRVVVGSMGVKVLPMMQQAH